VIDGTLDACIREFLTKPPASVILTRYTLFRKRRLLLPSYSPIRSPK
jgi:hypothetical protein